MSGTFYLENAGEAASYSDRLRADLVSLRLMLDNYPRPPAEADPLEALVVRSMRQLEAIAERFNALGENTDPARLKISNQESAALDAARDLRTRMMDALSLLQQDERSRFRPRS